MTLNCLRSKKNIHYHHFLTRWAPAGKSHISCNILSHPRQTLCSKIPHRSSLKCSDCEVVVPQNPTRQDDSREEYKQTCISRRLSWMVSRCNRYRQRRSQGSRPCLATFSTSIIEETRLRSYARIKEVAAELTWLNKMITFKTDPGMSPRPPACPTNSKSVNIGIAWENARVSFRSGRKLTVKIP